MQGDIRNRSQLSKAFATAMSSIDACIHFADLKALGESIQQPLSYLDMNVNSSRCLMEATHSDGCRTLVFSSNATLYGYPDTDPIPKTAAIAPMNRQNHTKAAVDQMFACRPAIQCIEELANRLPSLFQPRWRPSLYPHR